MAEFLEGLKEVGTALGIIPLEGDNSTEEEVVEVCGDIVDTPTFRQFLLIPATIFAVVLAFLQPRLYKQKDCCYGRPGFAYPMDILARSNRFSFAAAFGSMTVLCTDVIFEQKYAFEYTGPTYMKVFVALLSMLIYGIGYFPLFAGIALCNPIGYAIAAMFAWTFAGVTYANVFGCPLDAVSYVLLVVRGLPELLCHLYLCFSLPIRFILSFKRKKKVKLAVDFENSADLYDSIRRSYQGIHVMKLFKRPKPPPPEPDTKLKKIILLMKSLARKVFYKREPDFRYSARVISVMTVSLALLYQVTADFVIAILQISGYVEDFLSYRLLDIGLEAEVGESETIAFIREGIYLAYYIVIALRGCLLTSFSVAFLLNCLMILHSLSSYRNLLLSLYKGNPMHLIPKEDKSYPSALVGSMRYAGYQVGYIAWGYFIQFLILFLVSTIIAGIYTFWDFIGDWIIDKIHTVWPALLISIVVNFAQLLVAKFLFLKDNGAVMAIDNRRFLFIFTYFMFFYNIFIGLVSCLLRILKAMIVGALLLPRLDLSTLPSKFQWLDPGFAAFCGFMHVESAHTNPVAMVFISILQAESLTSLKRHEDIRKAEKCGKEAIFDSIPSPGSRRARWKWLLGYTLVRNPEICIQRKFTLAKQNKQALIDIVVNNHYFHQETDEEHQEEGPIVKL